MFRFLVLIFSLYSLLFALVFQDGYFYEIESLNQRRYIKKMDLNKTLWQKEIDSPFVRDMKYYKNYLYIVYDFEDDFVLEKIDIKNGESVFKKRFGSLGIDFAFSLAVDKDGIFIAGGSNGDFGKNMGESDIFLLRVSFNGDIIWKRSFGSEFDEWGKKIVLNKEYLFLICENGKESDPRDVFVIKLDKEANEISSSIIKTKKEDIVKDAFIDKELYILGESRGSFEDYKNSGFSDIYLARLSLENEVKKIYEFGGSGAEEAFFLKGDRNYLYFSIKSFSILGYSFSESGFFVARSDKNLSKIVFLPVNGKDIAISKDTLYIAGKKIKEYNLKDFYKLSAIFRFYTQFFKRGAKEHEVLYWFDRINKDGVKKAFFSLLNSKEFKEKNEDLPKEIFIKRLYKVFLNREPKSKALNFWMGFSERRVLRGILNSKEFKSLIESF